MWVVGKSLNVGMVQGRTLGILYSDPWPAQEILINNDAPPRKIAVSLQLAFLVLALWKKYIFTTLKLRWRSSLYRALPTLSWKNRQNRNEEYLRLRNLLLLVLSAKSRSLSWTSNLKELCWDMAVMLYFPKHAQHLMPVLRAMQSRGTHAVHRFVLIEQPPQNTKLAILVFMFDPESESSSDWRFFFVEVTYPGYAEHNRGVASPFHVNEPLPG